MNPNGRIARKRSVQLIMEELEYIIHTFRPKRISFGDELFSVDMPRTHTLLDAMIGSRIGEKVKWDVQTHVRYVNDGMFKKFKDAGVDRVELGIETGDEQTLRKMGKGTNIKMITDAYKAARKHKVKIGTFFILGQPNETPQSIRRTIKLAVKINPELPMFGLMTPYPGTAIADMAAKGENGYRLLSTDWDEYNKQLGGALEFQNISRRQLELYQSIAYLAVYVANFRVRALARFLWEYRVGIFKFAKKVLTNKPLMYAVPKPVDYDLLTSSTLIDREDMVASFKYWNKYQKDSMAEMRKGSGEIDGAIG